MLVPNAATPDLAFIASLLSVPADQLERALTFTRIKTGKEYVEKKNTVVQAESTRETLAKTLYTRLFRHIVSSINNAMALRRSKLEEEYGETNEDSGQPSVGVLDIFGFEVVEVRC